MIVLLCKHDTLFSNHTFLTGALIFNIMFMKCAKVFIISLTLIFLGQGRAFSANVYWIAKTPSEWENSESWSYTSGGSTCECVPGVGDVAIFDGYLGADGDSKLHGTITIGAVHMIGYAGVIDLNGFDLNIEDHATNNTFSTGSIDGIGSIHIVTASGVSFSGTKLGSEVNFTAILTTSTGIFTGGGGSVFGGEVNVTAYSVLLNGCVYNGKTSFTKTGPVVNLGAGGNTFNQATAIINNSASVLRTANTSGDIFNGLLTLTLNSTSTGASIQLAHGSGTTTYFNGDIEVNSVNNGSNVGGISFGSAGGTSELAAGFLLKEGSIGFLRGTLDINRFIQLGNTAQSLNLNWTEAATGSGLILAIRNCIFNGSVDFSASNWVFNDNTLNGQANYIIKFTGGLAATNFGGNNVFNQVGAGGTTYITVSNTGTLSLATFGGGDVFNGNVQFGIVTSTGEMRVGQTGTTVFHGNVTVTYGHASPTMPLLVGAAEFAGSSAQAINVNRNLSPRFGTLKLNNVGGLAANRPIVVTSTLDLTSGILETTEVNYVSLLDNAVAINANSGSYVDGPVRKTGNDAFVFPVGDEGHFKPISISAPSSVSSVFSAQYGAADHGLGTNKALESLLVTISTCEHWKLENIVGTDAVVVSIGWNDYSFCGDPGYISEPNDLRVAVWDGDGWENWGNEGVYLSGNAGSIESDVISVFGIITFGSVLATNPLPIELAYFEAEQVGDRIQIRWRTMTELNNESFLVERSLIGQSTFETIASIPGAGISTNILDYTAFDSPMASGYYYYRLRQIDFDGSQTISNAVLVKFSSRISGIERPYPNPVKDTLWFDRLMSIDGNDSTQLMIIDANGSTVYCGILTEMVSMSHLPSGTYIVRINSIDNQLVFKVVKK
jgi:hypothetical protein